MIAEVRSDVEKGMSLSQAVAKHPKVFKRLYVAMIRAGEIGGVLDSVLLRLAENLEKDLTLRQKIKSAMTYPAVVFCLVILIMIGMLIFVVPTFKNLYRDLGGDLPLPTRVLVALSDRAKQFWYVGGGAHDRLLRRAAPMGQHREGPRQVGRDEAARPRSSASSCTSRRSRASAGRCPC